MDSCLTISIKDLLIVLMILIWVSFLKQKKMHLFRERSWSILSQQLLKVSRNELYRKSLEFLVVNHPKNENNLIKTGSHRNLFDKNSLICGKESAADNFAQGFHCNQGASLQSLQSRSEKMPFLDQAVENLRLLSENCSSLQGFMITHSLGGGTGSGFTARFLEKIAAEYGDSKSKSEIRIHLILTVLSSQRYRPPSHEIVSFGHWLTNIRVQHLVLGSTTIDCNTFIWFNMWSVAV